MAYLPEEYRQAALQRIAEINAQLAALVAELEAIMTETQARLDSE